jgi:O-antigen/teichoic acid export membrane protein
MQNKSTLISRLIGGFGANAYGQLVTIIVQVLGVPILLHFWGTQMYGEWLILSAIPTYLSMVDLGFSLSAANDMTARVARGDHQGALATFQSLAALVYGIILTCLVISGLLVLFLPFGQWMHLTSLSNSETRWILWLLAASVLIHLADGVNHAGYRAYGEYAFHSFFNYSALLVQQLAVWATALLGNRPAFAALAMATVFALNTAVMTVRLFRRHRELVPGFQYANLNLLKSLIKPAMANLALPLANAINIQGMVLVVGNLLGPVMVVTFSTLRTLTRFAIQMVYSISHAFEPEMAAAWGNEDKKLLHRLYINNLRLSFWSSLGLAIILFLAGGWVVNIWTHGQVIVDVGLFNLLLVSAVASGLWYGGLNLLKAGNRHIKATIGYVLASGIAIVLAVTLVSYNSRLSSAGVALVAMDGLMVAYLFKYAADHIELPVRFLVQSILDLPSMTRELLILSGKLREMARLNLKSSIQVTKK